MSDVTAINADAAVQAAAAQKELTVQVHMLPPGRVSSIVPIEVRAGFMNGLNDDAGAGISFYLNGKDSENMVYSRQVEIEAGGTELVKFNLETKGLTGKNKLFALVTQNGKIVESVEKDFSIVETGVRSTRMIDGSWCGICHWSDIEGARWQDDIKKMTAADWHQMVSSMHECGVEVIVIQEIFRHQEYACKHDIPRKGYKGEAFYPSQLYPGRVDVACPDALKAILEKAQELGMYVFVGIGMYAWFDFTPESLEWHKQVAQEVWRLYGGYESFYGWYVSEEAYGSLDLDYISEEQIRKYRKDIIAFFKSFHDFTNSLTPGKPVMLAPNCHWLKKGEKYWMELFKYLDIVCPFGFERMPFTDMSGPEAAEFYQKMCDATGSRLWLDMEIFLFGSRGELYPRPIEQIKSDLVRYSGFEKIMCYQFPGMMSAPWAKIQPGGDDAVELYKAYFEYVKDKLV
ncbi:hypothetical protein SMSP2_02656 [Limihaloglobus sulfuriphilus]|uniref:DUF4434 domain-containing protein n=1 Tax=Limihaloglobus sulfuriphilus TaxID=1851148 RepID=A0A1Q2MHY9_9BACT|nr:DUF4434 domain-containing protein [Limihaloglobus sulfuriphilus]AQQ72274.1 hypothetical protein SMSP2_02656 [Limihaloglobus sulfuriphilus]